MLRRVATRNTFRQKSFVLQHEDWCEKAVEDGLGSRVSVGTTSRGHCAHRKAEIEEADDSSSRQEEIGIALPQWPRLLGRKVSCLGRWEREQQKAWRKQIFEVQTRKQERGPAGAVTCETRDLGIKWSQWHTLLFEEQVAVDMTVVCPQDVKGCF